MNRVVLFPTCLGALLYPRAVEAARRVLEAAGLEVVGREDAVCCGQPAWNSGHVSDARRVARGALDALRGDEPIVLCGGSCTTMMSHYWPELFEGTPQRNHADEVARRAREFSSFVADDVGLERLGSLQTSSPRAVAYHDSCHMLRGLRIVEPPRALLGAIEGLEVRELSAQDRCCGFGGTFSIRYPELSGAMADEKVDDMAAHDVDEVVAADLGCLMQITGRAEARAVKLPGRYIAEVVDEAMEPARA
jgi:L-lactate dehydrogenase complex protein LldE